jgi:hypothetical protein
MMKRWETETRYYLAWLHQDLFGEWVVYRMWGGKRNGRGSSRLDRVASEEEGRRLLEAIAKTRRAHGYREMPNDDR